MRTKQKLIAYFLSFALLLGMISTVNVSAAKKIRLSNKKITITKGSSKTIKVKNTKKKVKWKVLSGKKCITLKKKGKTAATVKGKKKGHAKIQALVEKKKLVCTVTVDDKVISEQQNNSQSGITTNIPGGNANNQSPITGSNEPEPTAEGDFPTKAPGNSTSTPGSGEPTQTPADNTPTKAPENNTPTPDNSKPTQTPNAVTTTEPPHQEEIITLHYNDDNADKVREQILNSKNPVHVIVDEGVTIIKELAFYECNNLKSIEIPESVTSIGMWAFLNCSGLTSIKVAENNQIYDSRNDCNAIIETETNTLISGCKNTKIPKSVTSIGEYAFHECASLTDIEIPESVTSIGFASFRACNSLTSIEIPESVTSMGESAFSYCNSLTNIKVAENNQIYDSRNDCNAIIETETNTLIIGCQNTKIPRSITGIGNAAFSGHSNLTNIEIPENVTSIGNYAFSGCSNLTNIEILESVTSIGFNAFSECSSLESIKIPRSVTNIEDAEFSGCSRLTGIEIPESITSIGIYAFFGCSSLTSIEIPESVTSIAYDAFIGCSSLTSIIWQDTTYNSADEFMNAFHTKYPDF